VKNILKPNVRRLKNPGIKSKMVFLPISTFRVEVHIAHPDSGIIVLIEDEEEKINKNMEFLVD